MFQQDFDMILISNKLTVMLLHLGKQGRLTTHQ